MVGLKQLTMVMLLLRLTPLGFGPIGGTAFLGSIKTRAVGWVRDKQKVAALAQALVKSRTHSCTKQYYDYVLVAMLPKYIACVRLGATLAANEPATCGQS